MGASGEAAAWTALGTASFGWLVLGILASDGGFWMLFGIVFLWPLVLLFLVASLLLCSAARADARAYLANLPDEGTEDRARRAQWIVRVVTLGWLVIPLAAFVLGFTPKGAYLNSLSGGFTKVTPL